MILMVSLLHPLKQYMPATVIAQLALLNACVVGKQVVLTLDPAGCGRPIGKGDLRFESHRDRDVSGEPVGTLETSRQNARRVRAEYTIRRHTYLYELQ